MMRARDANRSTHLKIGPERKFWACALLKKIQLWRYFLAAESSKIGLETPCQFCDNLELFATMR
jgi:hypothetical protein